MKALFIINEKSGTRRKYDVRDVIRASALFDQEIVACSRKEDLDAIIDAAEEQAIDVVFAVGGDGTVHETARRLIGRKPALGVLPTGSGNGFARHIGLPLEIDAALHSAHGGRIVEIDTALVNEHPFLGVMGIGFDAVIAERFASSTIRGLQTYVTEGLRAFGSFHSDDYVIEADGETMRTTAFVIAVANSGQYGNNARIAPLASLQDGLLDVVIIGNVGLFDSPRLLARLFNGTIHEDDAVTTLRTGELTIQRTAAGPAHLDGEPITLPEKLHLKVQPCSLRLLVPENVGAI